MTSFLDRLLGREPARKATYGGPALVAYQNGIPLSVYGPDWQARAKAYLAAYHVGWFYKAGSRISRDFANLPWTLAYEDAEGDNAEAIVAADMTVPFERLDPLEQFLRLAERPNPWQTGRTFRQQQQIRLDFTGRALIYLENGEGDGLPTAMFGISPHRMWPSYNARGELLGWVLDKDSPSGGTPFSRDEILVIEYPGPEQDPVGVVEAVYAHVPLTKQLPQHVSDVLATGGRLAGMVAPKERKLNEDEFQDAIRAWRNVTSDPNAARRLLMFPEPMEFTEGASSPKDLMVPELALLNRDEVLTAFPISPEMLMVPMATGLNSGQTQGVIEERYWSGTMHPRVEIWEDAFQQQLVSRYETAVGRPLDFDIDEPNLDDAASVVEKVGALRGLIAVGFEAKAAIEAVGLDYIEWNGLPELLDPAKQAEMAQDAAQLATSDGLRVVSRDPVSRDSAATQQTIVGKARITRDETIGREFPGLQGTLAAFLAEQRERVTERLIEVLPKTKAARMKAIPDGWWDAAAEDALLAERLHTVYLAIGRDALTAAAENTSRVIAGKAVDRVLAAILARAGVRITDINETTRKTIAETLEVGVRRGYSIPQLVNGVPGEGFGGVQGALLANGVAVWDAYRAEVIARTETMNAYNEAALLTYKDLNVTEVQAIDGDQDDDCAARDGATFTVDDALSIADHPNGTLDWVPVVD